MSKRVVLAMSGGVDSSAAAHLLLEEGFEVIGLFMRSGETEQETCSVEGQVSLPVVNVKSHKQGCCSASDAADARRVADHLDIPFYALNFQEAFGRIKDYFADEYLAGRTPNPCVMCNNWLKFGKLWEFAQQVGADHIASGHYAQLVDVGESQPALMRGHDPGKDQSYVLFGIKRDLLSRILFPVGSRNKSEIRALAGDAGLRTANKPDSQEICFIPDNDYVNFIHKYRGETDDTAGEIVDTAGNVVGHHDGYENFTYGQRKGLGAHGGPRFVLKIEPSTRRVTIGTRDELGRTDLKANRLNWLVPEIEQDFECTAQIRYQHTPAKCQVSLTGADHLDVTFAEPQYGITPGQAVVFYDDARVLGGGWIL